MTYIKKKRAREIYLAKRELFRCTTYKPRIIQTFPPAERYGTHQPVPMPVWP